MQSKVSSSKAKRGVKAGSSAGAFSREALVAQFDLHNSPGHLLRRCHSRARAVFDSLIGRETGLSKPQVALMVSIAHSPAATHAQLSEESGFDRNTLADTIDRLVAKGFVVRERSARDARAYEIHLTEEGHARLEAMIPQSFEVQAKIIEPIPEHLRAGFIYCLQLVAGVANADDVPESLRGEAQADGRARSRKRSAAKAL